MSNSSTISHCEESSKSSIFGSFNTVDSVLVASSILIVIASVVLLNVLLHNLFKITYDTPFESLLWNIEHELMIVGFTAFIFKIVGNLYLGMPHDWHAALEYADILVPIVAFVFCFQGLLLIVMTIVQTSMWSKGYHLLLEELLDKFYVIMDNKFSCRNLIDKYTIQQQMKFRIYRLIFCDQYRIKRDSLAFDSYVLNVYEKYLLHVIEIQPLDWLLVVVVVLINLANKLNGRYSFFHCSVDDTDCVDMRTIQGFT
jgi:hypothetical protein